MKLPVPIVILCCSLVNMLKIEASEILIVPEVVSLTVDSIQTVKIVISVPLPEAVVIRFSVFYSSKQTNIVELPEQVLLPQFTSSSSFPVKAVEVGQVSIHLQSNSSNLTRHVSL
ncbi:cystinosin-like [Leucoraja erinacea]|uniref:cystinosin-like n=1 Tax=Leucoraja erinaceus TaxID=7782 RepID=UPI00245744C5|nr:cystinosin-like [Leucoraja erinacea]XP_055514729.1 cystinosin-like [Leucoraja erinacea]